MVVERSLDCESRIVGNAGRRTFQGEEVESRGMEVDAQECVDTQKAGTRAISEKASKGGRVHVMEKWAEEIIQWFW